MKRIISFAIAIAMLFTFVPSFVFADNEASGEIIATHYYGDANLDEVLNTADASVILRICADMQPLTDEQSARTYEGLMKIDANKDDALNTADASFVLKVAADMLTANEYYEYAPAAVEHTVTFVDGVTEEVIGTAKVNDGADVELPQAPGHEGYTFTGWDNDGKNITADITITAQYEKNTYTVTFVDGVTGDVIDRMIVEHGDDVMFPRETEHEGYTFTGWDNDGKNITADITITALYEKNTYTVTFVDGVTEEVIGTASVNHGGYAELPTAPEHEGYTFTGWDNDGKNITADITITAQYEKNTYTVILIDGATGDRILTVTVKYGEDVELPTAPEHEGYTFTGWSSDGKNITANTAITAQYEKNTYTVTFVDGLTGGVIDTIIVEHGDDVMFPREPQHQGYTFTEWDSDGMNITADTTITAQYERNVYTVTFIDGYTGETITTQQVYYGEDAVFPEVPVHAGQNFNSWSTDGRNITEDTTITALYGANIYQVTFLDGLTEFVIGYVMVEYGNDVQLPTPPEHTGYTFTGWDSDGKNITADTTITALYQKNTYTVTFMDGLTGTEIEKITVYYGDDVMFPREPEHEGYVFTGWDSDGYFISEDTVITAQYQIKTYLVTFMDGLTNEFIGVATVNHGASVTFPTAPEHEGYTFTGWDNDGMSITAEITITAQYRINTYIVTFTDGLTGGIILRESVEFEHDAQFPTAPEHEGYTCTGWDNDGICIRSDITITAQYQINRYVVTFIHGITNEIIATQSIEHGKDAVMPEIPAYAGYNIIGWDKDGKNITADTVITALYEKITDTPADGTVSVNFFDSFNELQVVISEMTVKDGVNTLTQSNVELPDNYIAAADFSVTVTITGGTASPAMITVNVIPVVEDDLHNVYYVIKNNTGFNNMGKDLTKNYMLDTDIDLAGTLRQPFGWNTEDPEDDPSQAFTGIFDGGNHTVENLYMDYMNDFNGSSYSEFYAFVGLFARNAGTIRNLIVSTKPYSGSTYGVFGDAAVGVIAGDNTGTIENCHAFGNVGSMDYFLEKGGAGGICGQNSGKLIRCSFEGGIEGFCWIGGLAGKNFGDISESYFAGGINAHVEETLFNSYDFIHIGGLCGGSYYGTISDCYVYIGTNISGTSEIGGIIGQAKAGTLKNIFVINANVGTTIVSYGSTTYVADAIGRINTTFPTYSGLTASKNENLSLPSGYGPEWDMNGASHATFPDLVNNRRDENFYN